MTYLQKSPLTPPTPPPHAPVPAGPGPAGPGSRPGPQPWVGLGGGVKGFFDYILIYILL